MLQNGGKTYNEQIEFNVRNMKTEEIPQVMDIYKETEWHTGHDGIKKWHKLDPNAFKVAVTDNGKVLGVCCTVRLYITSDLHYFGFYVVRKEFRGKGIGTKVWNACKEHIGNRNVGTNSVPEKIGIYQTREQFVVHEEELLIQENDTLDDIISPDKLIDSLPEDVILETYQEAHLPSMYQYDFKVCGFNRELLLKLNCEEKETKTIVAFKNEECVGFGTIKRSCQDIPLVSPLYADDPNVAEAMLKQLMLSYPLKKGFYMATLFHNKEANDMIKKIGCPPTYKLARLYRRKVPVIFSPEKVYGVFDVNLSPL